MYHKLSSKLTDISWCAFKLYTVHFFTQRLLVTANSHKKVCMCGHTCQAGSWKDQGSWAESTSTYLEVGVSQFDLHTISVRLDPDEKERERYCKTYIHIVLSRRDIWLTGKWFSRLSVDGCVVLYIDEFFINIWFHHSTIFKFIIDSDYSITNDCFIHCGEIHLSMTHVCSKFVSMTDSLNEWMLFSEWLFLAVDPLLYRYILFIFKCLADLSDCGDTFKSWTCTQCEFN